MSDLTSVTLAEWLSPLSVATDAGAALPPETAFRTALLGLHAAEVTFHEHRLRKGPTYMTIRLAGVDDFDELAPLMASFNAVESIPWKPEAVRPAFERLCREPALGFSLVAEDVSATSVVGYVVVTYNYDLEFAGRDAFVTELYVVEPARRRGIAAALLGGAAAEARRNGAHALHLLVLPENEVAQALYRRAGFVATPRIMMTKSLDDSETFRD